MHANPVPSRHPQVAPGEIPELIDSGVRIGHPSHITLEMKNGGQGRVRLPEASRLQGTVLLHNPSEQARVRLWTDLRRSAEAPEFIWLELTRDATSQWLIDAPLPRPGRYSFTLQYSLDGSHWYWLPGNIWQIMVYPKQLQGMRMLTLIPNACGPMQNWAETLRQAADLNFSMLHILPITRQGHSQSPYAATELFQIEPDYLDSALRDAGMEPFQQLVALAQELGLGLCLDLVLNHVAIDSSIAQRCPHWIVPDVEEADGMKRAGFIGAEGLHKWNDLVLLHYNHPDPITRQAIWNYMERYALFWARYAADTGGMIRLDNLHSTPSAFAKKITSELRRNFPQLGILAELFSSHEATQQLLMHYDVDLLLATTWEHHFTQELRRYFRYLHDSTPAIPWFTPVNSHDSGVPAEEFADVMATRPRYILASLLGTGTAGMTQGVERGILHKINFIGRQPSLDHAPAADFRELIKKTNELLIKYPVFQQQANLLFVDSNHTAIIAALRGSALAQDSQCLVIANLDIHQKQSLAIDLAELGLQGRQLRDAYSAEIFAHHGPIWTCELEPCGTLVLICE